MLWASQIRRAGQWDTSSAAADASDARAKAGIALGPLDGTIVSIKDLFDVVGEVTRTCSKILAEEGKLAEHDAPIVQRLRKAGAVIIARTNMTEFAYSGVSCCASLRRSSARLPADAISAAGQL